MSLRQYLIALALGTAISISSWCIVTIAINPATAGMLAFFVFYLTLATGIAGIFTIAGTLFRSWKFPERPIENAVARSFRQGILLSILVIAALILLSHGVFSFGTMMLIVVLAALVELLFLSLTPGSREI